VDEVEITGESIRLVQLLKLANLVESGSDVRDLVQQGVVLVNGEVEARRGRQLRDGDIVTVGGASVKVVATTD
jgi:ribosome-associated protein